MNEVNEFPPSKSPEPDGAKGDQENLTPIVASVVDASSSMRPRIWTVFLVTIASILGCLLAGGIAYPIALIAFGIIDFDELKNLADPDLLEPLLQHPAGLWAIILPGQLAFLGGAMVAAALSPVALTQRLWMKYGSTPVWMWLIFAVATPTIGMISNLLIMDFAKEPSPHLKMIETMLTSQTGFGLVTLAFLVAVLPGISEELLFRGYLQSRLIERWSPVGAILASAAIFAIAHFDPMHAVGVFPLGIWFGIVAWRTDSLWPAIACHVYNNLLAVIAAQFMGEGTEVTPAQVALVLPSFFAMACSVFLLTRTIPREH